jgi:virginiamycin B lyase
LTEYSAPAIGTDGMTPGNDGTMWFIESTGGAPGGSPIGSVTTSGTSTTPFSVPASATKLVAGSDGNLWLTEGSANKIARVTP